MPEDKKRIRPVVEEVVESPQPEAVPETETAAKPEPVPEAALPVGRPKNFSFKLMFVLTGIVTLLVGFIAGGVYVYLGGLGKLSNSGVPAPTPLSTIEPLPTTAATPTPEPVQVDLKKHKLNVLNGSGKIGEAGRAEKVLEDAGFVVSSLGNAKNFDYKETLIEVKASVADSVLTEAKNALGEVYLIKVSETKLPVGGTYDIIVTVGSEEQ